MTTTTHPAWLSNCRTLSTQASKQFVKAYAKSTNTPEFITRIVLPNLWSPTSNICIAQVANSERNDDWARTFVGLPPDEQKTGMPLFGEQTFFTNPLKTVGPADPLLNYPSKRVHLGSVIVHTFEFDVPELPFFEKQMHWLRGRKRPTDSAMHQLWKDLSDYVEFLGICVAWSGNKSLHIHLCFDSSLLIQPPLSLDCVDPRHGFQLHWDRLEKLVMQHLDPKDSNGQVVRPDRAMRQPELFRRLPGGRRITSPGNLLGIPAGTEVPQLVLWEEYRDRVAKGSDQMFHEPVPFSVVATSYIRPRHQAAVANTCQDQTDFSPDELTYIEGCLAREFPQGIYPEFRHLEHKAGVWTAYFATHADDQKPSAVMKQDYRGVWDNGRALASVLLDQPLGVMMQAWRDEHTALASQPSTPGPHPREQSDIEREFQAAAVCTATTRSAMETALRRILDRSRWVILKGAEGSGKTTTLMRMHSKLMRRVRNRLCLYTFSDYPSADAKCREFNAIQESIGSNYRGMVTMSFHRAYNQACGIKLLDPITHGYAARKGYTSLWEAIEHEQPEIIGFLAELCEQKWQSIDGFEPVFFGTHELAHGWKFCTRSRLMWARNYWADTLKGDLGRDKLAKDATRLGMLVHDEVRPDHLVTIEPKGIVDWIEELKDYDPHIWGMKTSLADTLRSLNEFSAIKGDPRINGKPLGCKLLSKMMKLVEIRRLAAITGWQPVTITGEGSYPVIPVNQNTQSATGKGKPVIDQVPMYSACVGNEWMAAPRNWWRMADADSTTNRVAEWVVVTTTEALPVAVAREADHRWDVYELETPAAPRHNVEVRLDRSVTSTGMADTCAAWRKELGGDHIEIISNSTKQQLTGVRTPVSAKGANDYLGKSILHTMPFLAVALHEQIMVWNAYCGRTDCLLLYHVDQLNQVCGRNLGYRYVPGARSCLVAHPRLFRFLLKSSVLHLSRYGLPVHYDAKQRENIRAGIQPASEPASE